MSCLKKVNTILKSLLSKIKVFYILITCLLLVFNGYSQITELRRLFSDADSLCQYAQYEDSRVLVDSLLPLAQDMRFKLELLTLKAKSYELEGNLKEATSILIKVIDIAKKEKVYSIRFLAHLRLAVVYEKLNDLSSCKIHLDAAEKLNMKGELDHLYSLYYIRKSSYLRYKNRLDSAAICAKKALELAETYDDYTNVSDAHILLGVLTSKEGSYQKSNFHFNTAAQRFKIRTEHEAAAAMFVNISKNWLKLNDPSLALSYADTAFYYLNIGQYDLPSYFYLQKANVYEQFGLPDSAIKYFKSYSKIAIKEAKSNQAKEILQIKKAYENDKQEQIIKEQITTNFNQKIVLGLLVLVVFIVSFTAISLQLSRRKIRASKEKIASQKEVLTASLEEKKILMSELQHRVKNNLQMVIGLLGLQEEASADKSVKDIIRESQNRIESMAILHDKLFEINGSQQVRAETYMKEITRVLAKSYQNHNQSVEILISTEHENLTSKNAIPLGLILVELLSNSFKHAYRETSQGKIIISLNHSKLSGYKRELIYYDSGKAVPISKLKDGSGIGMTIVNGLVGQLKGKLQITSEDNLRFNIYF